MSETEHESYSENDLQISEYTIELDRDAVEIRQEIDADFDAVVIVKALEGELETVIDAPGELVASDEHGGRIQTISSTEGAPVYLRLATSSYAKVKVFIAKIRKGAVRALKAIPCTMCKKVIALIMIGFLVAAGMPPTPGMVIYLSSVKGLLSSYFKDVVTGAMGSVLKSLATCLGPRWEQKTETLLRRLNWIIDPAGPFYESACNTYGLCP